MPNHLGEYLRARRALVTPELAGLPASGVRRVPGLHREEVAMLAGISADYYLGLERGRDRNPSGQVLEAIARVLRLGAQDLDHLRALATHRPRGVRRRARAESVPPGTAMLLPSLPHPAYVEGRYFDVLAANAPAGALSPRMTAGGNQLRDLFLDPAEAALYADWAGTTECYVAALRQAIGPDTGDPRFTALTGELSAASARFRELWGRHDVRSQRGAPLTLDHPSAGPLRLHRERLALGDGLHLVILHAEPGSPDAERLARLSGHGFVKIKAYYPGVTAPHEDPA